MPYLTIAYPGFDRAVADYAKVYILAYTKKPSFFPPTLDREFFDHI
jgi:hypothetical protein